ncbi:hypothetical protein niasHT_013418 [Heterodera trifolii]|uniref:Uncharacterized protein n=1 Tax=Heterodera trifolii TaxID=157864 RepID=A0ABD2LD73_9BILA
MPCRRRPLPVELVNEFVSFVPGLFCRKFVLPTNSQFFHLLLRSKRSKIWKSESDDLREETALYAYGQSSPLFYARATVWGHFNDNSNALTSRFRCLFQMVQLNAPLVEWDVALVTFASRTLWRTNWNALSSTIHTSLIRIESGEVPPAVDPTPHDNPPTDSPPSLGGL